MKWRKLGRIFSVEESGICELSYTHSSNPYALKITGSIFRVFYSTRDIDGKSNISYFDYDFDKMKVVFVSDKLIIEHGERGAFDESGIGIGSILDRGNYYSLFYMAWQTPQNDHWKGVIGQVDFEMKSGSFSVLRKKIAMNLSSEDKISLSYPFVLEINDVFHIWYGSTVSWDYGNGEMLHIIKHAISEDLINWRLRHQCISHIIGKCQAFSRPSVFFDSRGFHMWYSFRGNRDKYRIGYAFSEDGFDWHANYENGPVVFKSSDGWDSEMVCYPHVFSHEGTKYMLYNGNGYGKTGIGLAVLEED